MGILADVELMMLLAFSGYCFLSYLLLKSPFHWHQYPSMTFRAQNVAHRAGGGEAHENTLNAVLRSVCNGVDMVELDLHLTSDGKVVVAHEDHLLRLAGVNKYISKLPYKKLPLLRKQIQNETDPDVKSPVAQSAEERRIPLLEEIFQNLRYLPVNIDIKQNNDKLIKEVNRMLIEYEREQCTVWGNEDEEVNAKLYAMNSNVHLFFSSTRVVRLLFLFYTGLLPFIPMKERFLEIPMLASVTEYYPEVRKKFGIFSKLVMQLGDALLLSPVLFDHLSRRKMHVFIWVLNKDEQFKRAFELGATAAMTDYPTRLAEYLLHNPPREPVEFPRLEAVAAGLEKAKEEVTNLYPEVSNLRA
uniref:GP-PDE domain-containing protein n=1 Tax=Trichuris muris TaxID=70415 RepID=A0A5S6QLG1_TRIMR